MKNAKELFRELCQAEFCERNAEKAVELLADNVCVIGTSDARIIQNREQALFYLSRETEQMEMPYRVNYANEMLIMERETFSTYTAIVELEGSSAPARLRISASAAIEKGESKLFFIHLSEAATTRHSDESYLIHEKTRLVEELLTSMNGGIATFRLENNSFYPEFVSVGVAKLLGMTVAEYKESYHDNIGVSVYESDIAMLRSTVEEALRQKKSTSLTYRSPHKDGGFVWINGVFSGLGFSGDGKPLVQAIFTPASQQFSTQTDILDSTSTGVYIIDRNNYELYYVNRAGFKTLKLEPGNYIGKTCYEVLHKRSAPCKYCKLHSAAESNHVSEITAPETGCTYMVQSKETDWNGKKAIIEYLTDITELKKAEEDIRHSMELIEAASAFAGMWIWVYDMKQSRAHCYRKLREDFNLPEYIDNYPESGLVFNSFSEEYAVAYREAIARIDAGSEFEELEYRGVYNGTEHWLQVRINRISEDGDNQHFAICTALPIDDQKRMESFIELERQKPFSNQEALLGHVVSNLSKNIIVSHMHASRYDSTITDGSPIDEAAKNSALYYVDETDRNQFIEAHNVEELLNYYERGGTSKTLELRRCLADGSIHWVRNTIDVLKDPVSGDVMLYEYCHDIDTDKKDSIALDSLIDDEIDYAIMVNTNTGMCHLVRSNWTPEEAQEWNDKEFSTILESLIHTYVHPDDQDKCMEYIMLDGLKKRLDVEKEVMVSYRSKPEAGDITYKVMRGFYLDDTHTSIVLSRRDVTNIVKAEKEQQELLQMAAAAAEKANRVKSEFMSNMSHDMRTPLNGILGLTYLMEKQQNIDVLKAQTLQLRESGEYLLTLINDVLDVDRIENGQLTLNPKPCDEELIFSSIIGMVTPLIEEKKIDFHFEKINIEWQHMLLDEQRVKQIFINLLSNAIKFTPLGGRIDFIMELVSQQDDVLRDKFIIRDNGIGMSQDFLPHIFESFKQENRGNVKANNGTGLGMPIVKQLVELMEGTITVESVENEGTEVTVYLNFPLAPRPNQNFVGEVSQPNLSGKRVLLCEDQTLNAKITKKLLAMYDCEMTWAENGKIGLEKFSASAEGYFDAILMDIRMPEMDGIVATKAIRKLARQDAKRIPIIALSANAYNGDIEQLQNMGMNAHLAKPYKPANLYELLTEQITTSEEKEANE